MKFNYLMLVGVVLMLLPRLQKDLPRGIRNNNAGNLENNGIDWEGLSSNQTDSRFYQFDSPVMGIRALARTLKTYQSKYNIVTVSDIIDRWAPPNENDTEAYKHHVASILGVNQYEVIDVNKYLVPLTESIILHENGVQPYPMSLIVEGVSLA